MKHATKTPSELTGKRSCGMLGAKSAALRGGSRLAICHSLVSKALPGMFICAGLVALTDSPLVASVGQGGASQVRVLLGEPVPTLTRSPAGPAAGSHSPSGVSRAKSLPVSRPQSDETAIISLLPASLENFVQIAFAGPDIAAFDVRAKMQHAIKTLDKARASGAAFVRAIEASVASDFADRARAASLSDHDRVAPSSGAALDVAAALAVSDTFGDDQSGEPRPAGMMALRADDLPFAVESAASDFPVAFADEKSAAGPLSTLGAQSPPVAPYIALPAVLDASDASYSGVDRAGSSVPDDWLAVSMVMPRLEDLEIVAAQSPAGELKGSSPTNFSGGNGDVSGSHLSLAYSLEGRRPDVSADLLLSVSDQIPAENPFQGDFEKQVIPASEDFGAGLASSLSGPPGSATRLDAAAAQADTLGSDDEVLVQLKTLVGMISDQFDDNEWERINSSRALEAYVSLGTLKAAGIPLSYDKYNDQLTLDLAAAQASPSLAGSGTPVGNGIGGLFGTTQSLAATASTGFDSNPFLARSGQGNDVISMRLQLAPSIYRQGERDTLRLSGRLEHIEYLGQYDSLQNYGADFALTHQANERLELNAGLVFSSDNLATNLANPFFNNDLSPSTPVPPFGNDITILGQQQRRTLYGANGGLRYTLSEQDELRWSINAQAQRFGRNGLSDSDFVSQQLGYSRRVDEGFTIGAIVDASLINFSDAALGDAKTISPQLVTTVALSPRLELSGSVGVAITRVEFGVLEETTTAVAGNLSLCREGERSNLCITGSRQVLPSAIGGARVQTTGGVSYSYRLSERDSLRINGSYSTASEPLALAGGDLESINGSVRFERQLDERLRFFVSGGYLNVSGNLQGNISNYQALIGVTLDLGNSR